MGRKINIKKRETHEKTLEIERGDGRGRKKRGSGQRRARGKRKI